MCPNRANWSHNLFCQTFHNCWKFSEYSRIFTVQCPTLCPKMCPNRAHWAHDLLCPTFHNCWIFSQFSRIFTLQCPTLCPKMCPNRAHWAHNLLCPEIAWGHCIMFIKCPREYSLGSVKVTDFDPKRSKLGLTKDQDFRKNLVFEVFALIEDLQWKIPTNAYFGHQRAAKLSIWVMKTLKH